MSLPDFWNHQHLWPYWTLMITPQILGGPPCRWVNWMKNWQRMETQRTQGGASGRVRNLSTLTLQRTNISHQPGKGWKRNIIFKSDFWWDMLVPWRVTFNTNSFSLHFKNSGYNRRVSACYLDKDGYRNPYQWVDVAMQWKDVFFASCVLRLNDGTRYMVAMPAQNSLQDRLRLGYVF